MPGLDINLFRVEKGGNPDQVRESCIKRGKDPKMVDQVIELDKQWRGANFKSQQDAKDLNKVKLSIAAKKKISNTDPCVEELEKKKEIENQKEESETIANELEIKLNKLLGSFGNLVHESVPVSQNEDDNRQEKLWGTPSTIKITGQRGGLKHDEVLKAIGGYDPQRGQNVAGHRGYFLKGPGVLLNLALINYGIQFLSRPEYGYTVIQPPFFMKKEIMAETCQLSDFVENLYQVTGGNDQYYLIATSQQPISALHRGEWLDQKNLPQKLAGYSSCFRKEAGAHGKDNWGIFRVHQFEKIEQFVTCKPQDSWKMHEEMIATAESFYQSLELPYRVINIVSGALNDAAAKKYDLEAWFPGYSDYRELVSCSNCTDFQSRNLNIRYRTNNDNGTEKRFVHMLNATLTATQRTLCCILENYQTEEGVRVPKVLQPFYGAEFIPFLPQEEKKVPAQDKKKNAKKQKTEKQEKTEEKTEKKTQEKTQECQSAPIAQNHQTGQKVQEQKAVTADK